MRFDFEPLATARVAAANKASLRATTNDTLLAVSVLQPIQALAQGRAEYLDAVLSYDRSPRAIHIPTRSGYAWRRCAECAPGPTRLEGGFSSVDRTASSPARPKADEGDVVGLDMAPGELVDLLKDRLGDRLGSAIRTLDAL